MSQAWLDRKQACDAYTAAFPADEWDADIHIVVGDYNFEDHWLFDAIEKLSCKLKEDGNNQDLRRRFFLLVDLLGLPMPEGWDNDGAI